MKDESPRYLFGVCVVLVYSIVCGLALWIWGFNDAHLRWCSRGIYVLAGYHVARYYPNIGGVIGGLTAGFFDAIFGRVHSIYNALSFALIASFLLQGLFFGFLGGLARMIWEHKRKGEVH